MHRSILCVLLTLSLSQSAVATFPEKYREARRAFAECERTKCGNWSGVAELMKAAAAEADDEMTRGADSRAGSRILMYGNWAELHLPYFYLGHALSRAGDLSGAADAWTRSKTLGFVEAELSKLDNLLENLGRVHHELGVQALERRDWTSALRHFEAASDELAKVTQSWMDAEEGLTRAETRLRELGDAERQWFLTRMGLDERTGASIDELARLRSILGANPNDVSPATLTESIGQLRNVVAEAEDLKRQVDEYRRQYQTDLNALKEAADAFFNDLDYRAAIEKLSGASFHDRRLAAQAALFRGLSLYAIHLTGGDATLEQAKAELRECRKLDPTLEPDTRYFSPRFLEFFRQSS